MCQRVFQWFLAATSFTCTLYAHEIEYCRISYESVLSFSWGRPYGPLPQFYDDFYHVFLKQGDAVLSFEPQNKMRVADDKASLGQAIFPGAECETIFSSSDQNASIAMWQQLHSYFARQAATTSYDVAPLNRRKNGHIVAREALAAAKLKAAMDASLNSKTYVSIGLR